MTRSSSNLPSVFGGIIALLYLLGSTAATATPDSTATADSLAIGSDSIEVSSFGSVTVFATRVERTEPLVDTYVPRRAIRSSDALDVAGALDKVPAARVQVNSRGEANLYLRNAGERQTALYFDGALLNVPWDNRIDLSLLPLHAVGGILVEKGTASVLYGANTMGGAVNILSRKLSSSGSSATVTLDAGENGLLGFSGTYLKETKTLGLIVTGSHESRDGLALSANAGLAFNQSDPELRTNTDRKITSLYARGSWRPTTTTNLGLSGSYLTAEKGVAPEGHLDPAIDRVRFWRYDDWRSIGINGSYRWAWGSGDESSIRGSVWATVFRQTIDQFGNADYDVVEDRQDDNDIVVGNRTIFEQQTESGRIGIGVTQTLASHDQRDRSFSADGTTTVQDDRQSFRAYTGSIAPEFRTSLDRVNVVAGAGLDLFATLESGDKPKQAAFIESNLVLAATYPVDSLWSLKIGLARKSRFPSMRELYGEALRRFLVNSDLAPESSVNLEAGVSIALPDATLRVTPFLQLVSNTIDQRRVDTLGQARRQRINLEGSTVPGFEVVGTMRPFTWLSLTGDVTFSRPRQQGQPDSVDAFLSEKPEIVATASAEIRGPERTRLAIEAQHTGEAYTLDTDNRFVRLGVSTVLNGRISWTYIAEKGELIAGLELFVRLNNALDAVSFPQLGLPAPGRELRGGCRLTL